MTQAQGKAQGFNGLLQAIKSKVSPSDYAAFLAALPERVRGNALSPPLPMAWLPGEDFFIALETAHEVALKHDLQAVFDIGCAQMRSDMNGVYRAFLKIVSPNAVLNHAARIWQTYTKDGGTLRVLSNDPGRCETIIEGIPRPSDIYWAYMRGSTSALLELTRAKAHRCEIVAGGGRESFAQFRNTWAT
jgi:hypothetical protein